MVSDSDSQLLLGGLVLILRLPRDCGRYNEIDIEEPAPDPRKFVFIVRRRFNPAVKPGQVDEPTVFVSLCSPHLIRVIRKRLEQDEDILSDVPTVPARSIFLIKDDLKRHYDETVRSIPNAPEHKQDELDAPKVKKRKTTPDEDSANEVVLTRDDLQAEVEHLDLLKEWLSEAFSDVSVEAGFSTRRLRADGTGPDNRSSTGCCRRTKSAGLCSGASSAKAPRSSRLTRARMKWYEASYWSQSPTDCSTP